MGNLVVNLINVASKTKLARGVSEFAVEALPKEVDVLFGGIKREGADMVELTHRVRNTGKSPYAIFDIKVKDSNGGLVDRLFGSISDWRAGATNYSVKWRKGNLSANSNNLDDCTKVAKGKTDKVFDKDVGKSKVLIKALPEKPPKPEKILDSEIPLDKKIKQEVKAIKDKKIKKDVAQQLELKFDETPESTNKNKELHVNDKSKRDQKPIAGVLPPKQEVIEAPHASLEPHPTQYIPNIRDYEMEALFDSDITKRLEMVTQLSKDGRQALFDPKTGKPNVFWTLNREEAFDYFLKLLGRK